MATNTRARSADDQSREMEIRLHEIQLACQKQIDASQVSLENKILGRIDQLKGLVTWCDSKIESYNNKLEEKINSKIAGLIRSLNLERTVGRDGEILIERSPILPTPPGTHSGSKSEDGELIIKEKGPRANFMHPRIELTMFGGEDPRSWLRKCNKFFTIHQLNEKARMELIELYMEGKADIWFQSYKAVKGVVGWEEFTNALVKRFGKKGGLDEQEEFNKLVQVTSVLDYVERFEELKSLLLCRNKNLDEAYFVSSFKSGLKSELKPMVRLMKPKTLLDAIEIAQFQEQTVDIIVKKNDTKAKMSNMIISKNWMGKKSEGFECNKAKSGEEEKKTEGGFKKISPEEF